MNILRLYIRVFSYRTLIWQNPNRMLVRLPVPTNCQFLYFIYIYIYFFFAYYRHIAARESETLKFRIEVSYYEVSLTKIFIH